MPSFNVTLEYAAQTEEEKKFQEELLGAFPNLQISERYNHFMRMFNHYKVNQNGAKDILGVANTVGFVIFNE